MLAFIDGAEDLPSPQRKALALNDRSAPSQPSKYGDRYWEFDVPPLRFLIPLSRVWIANNDPVLFLGFSKASTPKAESADF